MKNKIWEILLALKLVLIEMDYYFFQFFWEFFWNISMVHTVIVLYKPCDDVDSFQQGDNCISFEAKN